MNDSGACFHIRAAIQRVQSAKHLSKITFLASYLESILLSAH